MADEKPRCNNCSEIDTPLHKEPCRSCFKFSNWIPSSQFKENQEAITH